MILSRDNLILLTTFGITLLLWILFVFKTGHTATYEGIAYDYILKPFLIGMTVIPFLGGLIGLKRSMEWGFIQSRVGKGLFALSLGLFGWSLGMVVWNYYLFAGIEEVPFPSFGDLFYISIWPLWIYAMVQFSRVTGVNFGMKRAFGRVLLLIIPVVMMLLSYYLLFIVARGGVLEWDNILQLFFNIAYPLGDMLILTSALIIFTLSIGFLGGKYRTAVLVLLLGFVLNYIADFTFVYTTNVGTYFNAHYVDLLYSVMTFIVALGVSMFDTKRIQS